MGAENALGDWLGRGLLEATPENGKLRCTRHAEICSGLRMLVPMVHADCRPNRWHSHTNPHLYSALQCRLVPLWNGHTAAADMHVLLLHDSLCQLRLRSCLPNSPPGMSELDTSYLCCAFYGRWLLLHYLPSSLDCRFIVQDKYRHGGWLGCHRPENSKSCGADSDSSQHR